MAKRVARSGPARQTRLENRVKLSKHVGSIFYPSPAGPAHLVRKKRVEKHVLV
jgi:hypothetical protein